MQGHKAALCRNRHVQSGDIAKARQQLGIGADDVPIEIGQKPCAAPSAAHRKYRLHILVRKHRVDVCRAVLVLPGKIAVAVQHMRRPFGLQTHRDDGFFNQLDLERLVTGRRRFNQPDGIADAQTRWLTRAFCFRRNRQKRRGRQHCRQPRHNLTPSCIHIHTRRSFA